MYVFVLQVLVTSNAVVRLWWWCWRSVVVKPWACICVALGASDQGHAEHP